MFAKMFAFYWSVWGFLNHNQDFWRTDNELLHTHPQTNVFTLARMSNEKVHEREPIHETKTGSEWNSWNYHNDDANTTNESTARKVLAKVTKWEWGKNGKKSVRFGQRLPCEWAQSTIPRLQIIIAIIIGWLIECHWTVRACVHVMCRSYTYKDKSIVKPHFLYFFWVLFMLSGHRNVRKSQIHGHVR